MLNKIMDNLECRKKKFNGKLICKVTGKEINYKECNNCKNKTYKTTNYKINKRTNKLNRLEKERFSIFTHDLDHCIFCGIKKEHLHETVFGSNRLNSMKYGLVIPVCYKHHLECHKNSELQDKLKKKSQILFEKEYPDLDFMKIFGRNYK